MTLKPYTVESVASGFEWRAYVGADVSAKGGVDKATADKIIGGWAASRSEARKKAEEVFG